MRIKMWDFLFFQTLDLSRRKHIMLIKKNESGHTKRVAGCSRALQDGEVDRNLRKVKSTLCKFSFVT